MITDDLEPVVQFYKHLTGVSAVRPAPVFAELCSGDHAMARPAGVDSLLISSLGY